jgi:recombination protein RecR
MYKPPAAIERLIDYFNKLPGIGPKSAARLVFHLLYSPEEFSSGFADTLKQVKSSIFFCRNCHNITESELCLICEDSSRSESEIMVVEDVLDLFAFEQIGEFKGRYHVLGGVISPVQGIGPEEINVSSLLGRIKKLRGECELIIATNPTLEGEATGMYLKEELKKYPKIIISRLARGIPTGADLDYADRLTLKRALSGRTRL